MLNQATMFYCPRAELSDLRFAQESLASAAFVPVSETAELSTKGFIPLNAQGDLCVKAGDSLRFVLREEDKIIPKSVVDEFLAERVEELEEKQFRTIGKKEKTALRAQITDELRPQAFSRKKDVEMYYDSVSRLLFVATANQSRAENCVSFLRAAMEGGLETKLPQTRRDPASVMTQWLLDGEAEGQFALDGDCVLRGMGDDQSLVRISNCPLESDEVRRHAQNGKVAQELGLVWGEKISLTLTDSLSLKRLKLKDVIGEDEELPEDDAEEYAKAVQKLTVDTLSIIAGDVFETFGGRTDSQDGESEEAEEAEEPEEPEQSEKSEKTGGRDRAGKKR